MRRNIGSELIVALLAAVSLIFAAVFAVLLSTSTSIRPTAEPVEPATATFSETVTQAQPLPILETATSFASETPLPATATETALPTTDGTTSLEPQPTEAAAKPTTATEETSIAPANLTLTAIRGTVVAGPSATAEEAVTVVPEKPTADKTSTLAATIESATIKPQPTEEMVIAPANLTLTAIRGTVDAGPAATAEEAVTAVPERPTADETTTDESATIAPQPTEEMAIAPANLTLTAIRETVVAVPSATVEEAVTAVPERPTADKTRTLAATIESATIKPQPTEEMASAPANLTLTAIRRTVVAGPSATAEEAVTTVPDRPTVDETRTLAATDESATIAPQPTEEMASAPANLTLTAIRRTVVAVPSATAEEAVTTVPDRPTVDETRTLAATDESATIAPQPTEEMASAPANLTLTAIRRTVVAGPSPTADEAVTHVPERPTADETRTLAATDESATIKPQPTEEMASAPANLTLTAIRGTVVAGPSPTVDEAVTAVPERPTADETRTLAATDESATIAPQPTEETASTPANLTLTAIRRTVVANRDATVAGPAATVEEAVTPVPETPKTTTDESATIKPQPTEETASAPANLTLTAIRRTIDAGASPTADEAVTAMPETPIADETRTLAATDESATIKPQPTEETASAPANLTLTAIRGTVVAGASPTAEEAVTTVPERPTVDQTPALAATIESATIKPQPTEETASAPANLTLTAIRGTVAAGPSPTAEEAVTAVPERPTADETRTLAATDESPTIKPQPTEETAIAPANLTLTAIRGTVVAGPPATADEAVIAVPETPTADKTSTLAATDESATIKPQPTEETASAPANLTLTAIRGTVVAGASPTAEEAVTTVPERPTVDQTPALAATIESATIKPQPTEETASAPANLTLTAIRGTVAAGPAATAEEAVTAVPETPTADKTATDESVTIKPQPTEETASAPANLTLTAIRKTVVAGPAATADEAVTAVPETPTVDETRTLAATIESATIKPQPTEETASAPANLTLTAIRRTVVAGPAATAEEAVTAVPERPTVDQTPALAATDESATIQPQPTEETASAPANLTLTVIRRTVVASRDATAAGPSATVEEAVTTVPERPTVDETKTLAATIESATIKPQPAEETASAPANLTLTAIRRTVVAVPSATADEAVTAVSETPTVDETTTIESATIKPQPTEETASAPANLTLIAIRRTVVAGPAATAEEAVTTVPERPTVDETRTLAATDESATIRPQPTEETASAPANLTLTAIRGTVVAGPAATVDEAVAAAPETPKTTTDESATIQPQPTEETASAPANLTLTAIRGTVVAGPSPTVEEAVTTVFETPTVDETTLAATDESATIRPQPTEETASAPANLTLAAIRETVVAGASATADEAVAAVPDRPTVQETATDESATIQPQPTEEMASAPANLTLTVIRRTVVAGASPTAEEAVITARATSLSLTAEPASRITPSPTPLRQYFVYLIPTPTAYGWREDASRFECQPAPGWINYEVREGDTLLSLALATGSSLIDLRSGNCFEPIRGIFAGEQMILPRLPQPPLATRAPGLQRGAEAGEVLGCEDRLAQIAQPAPNAELDGIFAIIGSVRLPKGGRYHIALKPGWSEDYYRYWEAEESVSSDVLALMNTDIFGAGAQRLRLAVLDSGGEIIEGGICDIPIIFASP